MSWAQMPENRVIMCYVVVNTAVNFRVSQKAGNECFNWATLIFSSRALLSVLIFGYLIMLCQLQIFMVG
jgi:hypothetical protein